MNEDAWLDDIRPLVPGAVDTGIKQSIRSAVNELYVNTGAYVFDYPAINVAAGVSSYSVPDVAQGKVLYLLAVSYNNSCIRTVNTGTTATVQGVPNQAWLSIDPNTVNLNYLPENNITGGLELKVAITPLTTEGSDLPSSAGTIYYQFILDGALGRLYKQPGKPWTNAALSRYHLQRFRVGMAKARELSSRGYSTSDIPWRFPPWA